MSPTSYQAAPPREFTISTHQGAVKPAETYQTSVWMRNFTTCHVNPAHSLRSLRWVPMFTGESLNGHRLSNRHAEVRAPQFLVTEELTSRHSRLQHRPALSTFAQDSLLLELGGGIPHSCDKRSAAPAIMGDIRGQE